MADKKTSLNKLSSMAKYNKVAIDAKQSAKMQNKGIQTNQLCKDTLDAFSYGDACQENRKHIKIET